MAAELKHTKGPWRVEAGGIVVGPDDGFVPFGGCGCCGSPWLNGTTEEEEVANAHLIAAAPELLDILNELFEIGVVYMGAIEQDNPGVDFEEWGARANAIIKKATVST